MTCAFCDKYALITGVLVHFDYTSLALYERWGKTLGKLHHAALSYKPGSHVYTSWKKSLDELHDYAQHESQALQDTLSNAKDASTKLSS